MLTKEDTKVFIEFDGSEPYLITKVDYVIKNNIYGTTYAVEDKTVNDYLIKVSDTLYYFETQLADPGVKTVFKYDGMPEYHITVLGFEYGLDLCSCRFARLCARRYNGRWHHQLQCVVYQDTILLYGSICGAGSESWQPYGTTYSHWLYAPIRNNEKFVDGECSLEQFYDSERSTSLRRRDVWPPET